MSPSMIDQNALRTHQAILIGIVTMAFIVNSPAQVALTALVMLVGTIRRKPGFLPVYNLLLTFGWLHPNLQPDQPEPHRFAHLLGTLFLLASTATIWLGSTMVGWILALLVVLLAGLNLFLGFCAGCALYYWLARLGIPHFQRHEKTKSI